MTVQQSSPGVAISRSGVTIEPVSGRIGAVISGLDISEPLDDASVELVQRALDTWKVVFFRDQHLDHASQIAFGRRFGKLTYAHPHDDAPPDGYPEIYTVDDRRFSAQFGVDAKKSRLRSRSLTSGWHTDVTPAVNPPAGSVLRADVVPSFGGDTTFTNLVAAYEGLSEPVQAFVGTLRAEHRYGANWLGLDHVSNEYGDRINKNRLVAVHPVVRVHPRTGSGPCSSTPTSSTTSWMSRHSKAGGSSSTSSMSCFAPSTPPASVGSPAAWRSGTTGLPLTSPPTTSTI